MTKKHKKNYCKRANKSKLSLKRRLQSVYSFFFYFTFLVFEVTPELNFKGKVVLWSLFHNLEVWSVSCNPHHTKTVLQLAGLVYGTANPQSPYGKAGRGVSSSPLVERKQQQLSCVALGSGTRWVFWHSEQDGKCWSSWPESWQILAASEAPIYPEDSLCNHWRARLCSPNWDCPGHLRISEM